MPNYFEHRTGIVRPVWRGRIHTYAAFAAVPACAWLVWHAKGNGDRFAVLVYSITLITTFAISASYHRLTKSPRSQKIMRQFDHASIYTLIAGTYTPMCAIAAKDEGGPILAVVWAAAAVGVVFTITQRLPRIALAMYIAIGWVAVLVIPRTIDTVGWSAVICYFAGGLFYTVGAIMFFLKKPRLVPHHFGFHELWHIQTVIAAVFHFIATAIVVS